MLWWQHFGPTFYRIPRNAISRLVNEYLSSILHIMEEEMFQPKTCTHRLLLCSMTLAPLDGGTFFYLSLKTTYTF